MLGEDSWIFDYFLFILSSCVVQMTPNSTSIVCTFCFCGCEVVQIVEQLKSFDGSTFNQLCVFAFVLSHKGGGGILQMFLCCCI